MLKALEVSLASAAHAGALITYQKSLPVGLRIRTQSLCDTLSSCLTMSITFHRVCQIYTMTIRLSALMEEKMRQLSKKYKKNSTGSEMARHTCSTRRLVKKQKAIALNWRFWWVWVVQGTKSASVWRSELSVCHRWPTSTPLHNVYTSYLGLCHWQLMLCYGFHWFGHIMGKKRITCILVTVSLSLCKFQ